MGLLLERGCLQLLITRGKINVLTLDLESCYIGPSTRSERPTNLSFQQYRVIARDTILPNWHKGIKLSRISVV